MKKVIRFLASVSGVESEIRKEQTKQIGGQFIEYSYWFGGDNLRIPVGNALMILGSNMLKNTMYGADRLRNSIDELGVHNIHKLEDLRKFVNSDNYKVHE